MRWAEADNSSLALHEVGAIKGGVFDFDQEVGRPRHRVWRVAELEDGFVAGLVDKYRFHSFF